MTSVTHDEAINILRNAGSEVNLTVKHYRSAAPFLLKNVRQLIPDMEPNTPVVLPPPPHPVDENDPPPVPSVLVPSQVPVLDSPCSVNSDGSSGWNGIPRVRRKWIDVVEGTYVCTVWKFQDFSVTQILREINLGAFRCCKTALFAILGALSYVKMCKNLKIMNV